MLIIQNENKDQIVYCLSQLKRFAKYFKSIEFYRLQQLCSTPDQKNLW